MKRTRGLWASIIFVAILVALSLVGFATGALKPTLGLDLEGGVSVILSAPDGTPRDVMEQTLGNIRNRVDAFGVGEPEIVLSGTTIEIQIPGLAKGTIEQRQKDQFCLTAPDGTNYGCAKDEAAAQAALDVLVVEPQATEVCLVDPDGTQLDCFGSRTEAVAAKATLQVAPKASATPTASASTSATPSAVPPTGEFCLTDATGAELACYPTKKAATAAQEGVTLDVTQQSFCVTGRGRRGRLVRLAVREPEHRRLREREPDRLRQPVAHHHRLRRPGSVGSRGAPVRSGRPRRGRRPTGRDRGRADLGAVLRDQLRRAEPGVLPHAGGRRATPARDRPGDACSR